MLSRKFALVFGLLLLTSSFTNCAGQRAGNHQRVAQMPAKTIEEVQEAYTDEWMSNPGVVGTGIGEFKGKPCIKIFVAKKTEALEKKLPSQVEGFPVIIEETGEFRALGVD